MLAKCKATLILMLYDDDAMPLAGMVICQVMAPNRKIFALKRIRLTGRDAEAAAGFIDEIRLLQSLRNQPNIIQLIDAEVCACKYVYMVKSTKLDSQLQHAVTAWSLLVERAAVSLLTSYMHVSICGSSMPKTGKLQLDNQLQ